MKTSAFDTLASRILSRLPSPVLVIYTAIANMVHEQNPEVQPGQGHRIARGVTVQYLAERTLSSTSATSRALDVLHRQSIIGYYKAPGNRRHIYIMSPKRWKRTYKSPELTSRAPISANKHGAKMAGPPRSPSKSKKVKGNTEVQDRTTTSPAFQIPRLRPLPPPAVAVLLGSFKIHFNRADAPEWKPAPKAHEKDEWIARKDGIHSIIGGRIDPTPCFHHGELQALLEKGAAWTREASGDHSLDAGILQLRPLDTADYRYSAARSAAVTFLVRRYVASWEMDHWERKKDAKFWFLVQVERNCERNIQRLDLGKKPFFSMSTIFQFKQDPETKRRTVLDESYLACDGTAKAMAASFRRRISERRKPKVDRETEKRERARKESEHRAEVLPPDISRIRCRALIAML